MRLVPSRLRSHAMTFALVLGGGLALPAMADVLTIERAMSDLEMGAYFMVIAEVTEQKQGRVYEVEDDTGSMLIYLPESLERGKSDTVAQPLDDMESLKVGERVRLWGQLDDTPLNPDTRGMRVFRVTPMGGDLGGRGAPAPEEPATPAIVVSKQALAEVEAQTAAPAAPNGGEQLDVMRPKASAALEQEVRGRMQAYRAAEARALEAGEAYARAAREAGSNGQVDPSVVKQLDAAEAEVAEIRGHFRRILTEARSEGVDETTIRMIETEVGLH